MPIQVPAEVHNRWVLVLEPLAERDTENRATRYPDGILMTPKVALQLLSFPDDGVTTIYVDDDASSWPRTRVVAMDDVVTLSSDDNDEWAKNVIANAERLTGIKLDSSE